MFAGLVFVLLVGLSSAQQQACAGEYSTCPTNGVCALVVEQCAQCTAGQYACPLSSACVDSADDLTACPGLSGTHFDTSLSVSDRVDFIVNQLSLNEMLTQMTENATEIARLCVPAYNWLNDDLHGVKQPDATAFPNGPSLGASWNTSLLQVDPSFSCAFRFVTTIIIIEQGGSSLGCLFCRLPRPHL